MSRTRDTLSDQPRADRKVQDRALILPIIGFVVLVPPLAGIFQLELRIAGVPFTALYLFTVWAILIACSALLSRRLRDADPPDDSADTVHPSR